MATELIGITQLAKDWGLALKGRVNVDSSAAIGTVSRRGNGKLRHVQVGTLWIQEKVEDGDLDIEKVEGNWNPADALTKHVNGEKLGRFRSQVSQESRAGRSEKSLKNKVP